MSDTLSKSFKIMLIAMLVSGFATLGWAQGTNRYNTGGDYAISAPTNTRFLMQMTSTNAQNPYGDNNLVWSHSGRYLATDRIPMGGGGQGNPYINLIGFGKTGSITNLGARSDTNDWIFANTTDFTWNDDRILFVSPTRYSPPPPFPPRWLRIMSCTTTGATLTVTNFFSAPAIVSNHVYSPSVVYDPAIQKERLLFIVSNSTNSPPPANSSPLVDNKATTRANVYTVFYNRGDKPATNWDQIWPLTAFTNNIQIQSVRWCPELGTNFQPLANRYAMLVKSGPGKKLYVFTGVRDILTSQTVAPSNFADPRFSLREANICDNSQMTWTFDGDFLMYGVIATGTSQLYSVRSEGANTNRILFPTPGTNAYQNKQWLCVSPNGMRAAFTINSQLFLLPLQCENNAAQTNAGATNIITDGSYTRVVIPGSALPQTNDTLTNFTFSIMEPTEVDTNQFPSEYAGNAREFSVNGLDTQVNFRTDVTNVEMSLHFEDSDVPDGVSETNMSIFLYNPQTNAQGRTGTWTQVQSTVDTNTHYITSTNIQHFSTYALGQQLAVPDAPSGLTASDGTYTDKVALAWTSVADADSYIVFRGTNANINAASSLGYPATNLFNDTTGDAGAVYYYWVAASNAAGVSGLSASNTGYRALPAPTGVTASDGTYTDKVRVTWNPVTGATSYNVYRHTSNNSGASTSITTSVTTTNYDDTSAEVDVPYYYWVKAKNATTTSDYSSVATGRREPSVTTLSAPTNVAASDGTHTTKIAVTWDSVDGATSYLIFRSQTNTSASAAQIATSTTAAYDDTAATNWPGITLYYWIKAKNSLTTSDYSVSDHGYCGAVLSGSADLATSGLLLLPASIAAGAHPTYASFVIQNIGPDALADNTVSYDFYLSRNDTFDTTTAIWIGGFNDTLRLTAGADATITLTDTDRTYLTIPADATGTYYVFVRVRAATISDPDLSNNVTKRSGTISIESGVGSTKIPISGDFDGDRKNDLALYQESSGTWSIKLSASSYAAAAATLGGSGYSPIAQDFDGDSKADLGVYDITTGNWAIKLSASSYSTATLTGFGSAGAVPAVGDYDGDRKADPAIYYGANGLWLVELSGSSYATAVLEGFGGVGYTSLALDFDGDGKVDPAIYQDATGNWMVRLSGSSYATAYINTFGGTGYQQVSGMYDQDVRADAAVYQTTTGNWNVMLSSSAYITATLWGFGGEEGYVTVVGDFDGDGKVDPALYNAALATWFVKLSGNNYALVTANQ